jgi:hypothetical protein
LEVNPSFIKAIASAIILGSEGSGGSGENNKTKNLLSIYYYENNRRSNRTCSCRHVYAVIIKIVN